ncbi:MAG: hypothetical protein Q8P97_01695 [bacterium]|nr:hypothetical protein [bacterium]
MFDTIMDPRFRPLSFEIIIAVAVFLFLSQSGILSTDISNPITLTVALLFVVECFRILYKLRKLRKAGVNIAEQSYRSPVVDAVSPQMGNAYSQINKWAVRLLGLVLVAGLIWFFYTQVR